MTLTTEARLRRLTRGALIAVLMCGAAGAAMAAPARGPDPRDAKIEALQQQIEQMNNDLAQLRSSGGASNERLDAMQAQLNSFAQVLADMKSQTETATADIATLKIVPPASVTTTLPNGKPALATADGRFTANIRSTMMFDATHYFQDSANPDLSIDHRRGAAAGDTGHARDLNNGTTFRRARLGLDGKVFGFLDYGVVYEFGGSGGEDAGHIHEMWLQYNPPQLKGVNGKIKVGAFEPIIGLSASVSTGSMAFIERPAPAEVARNVAAGDARSAIQLYGNGDLGAGGDQGVSAFWMASTAFTGNTVGTLNSAASGFTAQPFDEQKAWIGRFAVAPHSGTDWLAHFGVNFQYVFRPNDAGGPDAAPTSRYTINLQDRPESRVDGTRLVGTGGISAKSAYVVGLEGAFQVRQFYVEGEWFRYAIDRYQQPTLPNPRFSGWYVQGSWVLTGEPRRYNQVNGAFDGPAVNFPFNPSAGTWGAWEVTARYSDLDLNFHEGVALGALPTGGVRGGEQQIFTAGINWYLNPTVRFMLNFQHVKIDHLSPSVGFGNTGASLAQGGLLPVGTQIGQDFNAVTLRSQLAF